MAVQKAMVSVLKRLYALNCLSVHSQGAEYSVWSRISEILN